MNSVQTSLQRLGDLMAMQELLPRVQLPDGSQFLGYRLFGLMEGGLGEAIWQQRKGKKGEGGEEGELTTVLISLNLTRLGSVQARLGYGENQLQVGLSASEEGALAALRGRIRELRGGLLATGLPLRSLEVARMGVAEMRVERQEMMGLASGFSAVG
ncbi:MAG: flagellar hook-length control protein FliK [Magnetococcales bacterium]|nr:flagellar hook-length control protein FliK [Magnetococcales bacterium]